MKASLGAALLVAAGLLGGCAGDGDGGDPTPPSTRPAYALDPSIASLANETYLALASPNESDAKTEVDIVVNPFDPQNVFTASKDRDPLASPGPCVWAVGQVSKDGGRTWATTYVGGTMAERRPGQLLYGWRCITDPIMVFNRDGDLYYALQVYDFDPVAGVPTVEDPVFGFAAIPPDMGIQVLAVSHDGGETFPPEEMVLLHVGDSGALVFHDYMRMGTNPQTGTVFTIWNQITASTQSIVTLVGYEPGSDRAREPVYLTDPPGVVSLGESGIVGMADGTVVAWMGGFNSPDAAYFAVSNDDGRTFGPVTKAFDFRPMGTLSGVEFRHGTVVELAVDNTNGTHAGCWFAVWAGQEAGAVGPSDVYMRRSCDKGASWSDSVLVNPRTREDGQWMPRVTVDGHGVVHVVHYSRHHDPEHRLIDAEWAYSRDGGETWQTQRVTTTSFDGDLGIHQDGFPFIGDYVGIASVHGDVYMAFPSTVTGRAEIAVAKAVADESVVHAAHEG